MIDKNLFPYDLAVTAIFKNEARYLKEWLDYHLAAGVDHFYLYNNESSDNFAEVLAPYINENLVTFTDFPGKLMQIPAYVDALNRFKFHCRCMAFIDLDEFILPQTNRSIVEVVDEILSRDSNAAALAISEHSFGSNGLETADYSKGILERFTRRAPDKWEDFIQREENFLRVGNMYVKIIANPRLLKFMLGPHVAVNFGGKYSINERGEKIEGYADESMCADKIIINHYSIKSREEYFAKNRRGVACDKKNPYSEQLFEKFDRNDVFDDGILTYRNVRAENFSVESDADRLARVTKTLTEILTQRSPFDAPAEFFAGKLETFLTCRALAEAFDVKIGARSAEEYALVWIYQCMAKTSAYADLQLFLSDLPEILARPFPLCKKLNQIARKKIFPVIYKDLAAELDWSNFYDYNYIHRLLNAMK